MILTDREIEDRINNNHDLIISNFDPSRLSSISYDLNIAAIISDEKDPITGNSKGISSYYLQSGETIYIKADVELQLPLDHIGIVYERNSVMRQGLVVDGPVYQPGHRTNVFLRVHNIFATEKKLSVNDPIAQIRFEKLSSVPNHTYTGNQAYQDEKDYRGVQGELKHAWESETVRYQKKIEELNQKENRIYGNVLTFMTIFVTIFSLLTFNLSAFANEIDIKHLIMIDLSLSTIMYLLLGGIFTFINSLPKKKCSYIIYWIVAIILIIINIILCVLWI